MFQNVFKTVATLMIFSLTLSSAFAGTVTGKVNIKGAAPAMPMIKMNADPKCVKMHSGKDVASEQVVVNPNKTLRWVFVYVKKGLEGKKFPTPNTKVTIDQKGCMYSPHVFGVVVNQPIDITNSDATLHNIHALPKTNKGFNIAQPKQGMKMTQKFDKPEMPIKIKCEVHNWMASYVCVMDNPFFAVTDDKGNFEIKNLPDGDYVLEAWHEKFGTQEMNVSVKGGTATADFTFEAK
jgi:plastocyanin